MNLKLKNSLFSIAGILFIVAGFAPLGLYHPEGYGLTFVHLWNFMLPTGWLSIISGVVLEIHNKIGLTKNLLVYVIFIASLLSIALFFLQDVDYFLGLWTGIYRDFDAAGLRLLSHVPLYTGLFGVFASLLLIIIQHNSNLKIPVNHQTETDVIY